MPAAPPDTLRPLASADSAYHRGLDRLSAGDARGAADDFRRALTLGYRPPAEAHLALGRARRQLPLHAFRAIRSFRDALRADPSSLEALYGLADGYLALDGWEAQREARGALIGILEHDPFYRDAYARWQSMYLDEEENARVAAAFERRLRSAWSQPLAAHVADLYVQIGARDDLEDLLRRWSAHEPVPSSQRGYYAARAAFAAGRNAEATAVWREALAAARWDEDLTPFWDDVLPLLDPEEAALRRTLPVADQAAFLREFWELRDPLPFSGSHERLAEQYRRIAEARRRYLWKKPMAKSSFLGEHLDELGRPSFDTRLEGRSLDDRGTLFLRHGEPDQLFIEVGGAEFWRYVRLGVPGGRLHFHFKLMEGPLASGNDTVYSMLPTTDAGAAHVRQGHAEQEALENTVAGLTTDTYGFDYGPRVFPVATAAATFRNPADRWRTDVVLAYAVPVDSLLALGARPGAPLVGRLRLYGGDEPRDLEETGARVGAGTSGRELLVRTFELTSEEGPRHFVVQVDEVGSGSLGQARGEIGVPSYGARELQLSDVLLAAAVAPGGPADAGLERGGLAIRPLHPLAVLPQKPVHLYYEIYDPDTGADGRVRYRVEYRLRAERTLRPGLLRRIFGGAEGAASEEPDQVALAFEREAPGPAERLAETISLDLGALPPGRYRLAVSVRDLASGREVERSTELELSEAAP